MSVYRHKGSPYWQYDFVFEGRRFHGSTGTDNKRAAQAFERRKRQEIAEGRQDRRHLTLDEAAGEYWRDIGQTLRSAQTVRHRITMLLRCLAANTDVAAIKTATVAEALRRRRAITHNKRAPAPSTVNRDIIDTLRPILRRAAMIHEIALPTIDWCALRGDEPREIVREFSHDEIVAWGTQLKPVERVFLGFALTYGCRFGEMFFALDCLDVGDPDKPRVLLGRYKGREGWRSVRKDGSLLPLPLQPEHATALAALAARASAAGLDTVWFDEDSRGRRVEISYWAMRHRLTAGAQRAGIKPGRIIHGMRHHAGTTLLRETGNLILVQRLLGHRHIATTQRYAHASEGDLRAALGRVSRNSPALPAPNADKTEPYQEDE